MYKVSTEVAVGTFVTAGLACLIYLSVSLGEAQLPGSSYYHVNAIFDSVTGLKKGASVEIAGVPVGRVLDISLDRNRAVVAMAIRNGIALSVDTTASVRTKGIIGDMFVKLSPGGHGEIVKPHGLLVETESTISIEELISKYLFEPR